MATSQIPAYLKSIGAGALAGAGTGSAFGPIGAGVGGLTGGLAGALSQYLSGIGQQTDNVPQIGGQGNPLIGYDVGSQQFPRFNQQQLPALNELLSRGLSNSNFDVIEQNAFNRFNRQGIPGLAAGFNGLQGKSRLSSPTFQRDVYGAQNDLLERLSGLRAQHGLNELQLGLQPTFENIYTPAQPGLSHALTNPEGISQIVQLLTQLLSNIRR